MALLSACLILSGVGCATFNIKYIPDVTAPTEPAKAEWTSVQNGIDRMEYLFGDDRFSALVVYRFSPDCCSYQVKTSTEPKDMDAWALALPDATLLVNAAYFHEDLSPSGLLISEGKRVGDRSFDLDKSGLITLAPQVRILDTATETFNENKLTEALQSYPFLMKDSEAAVKENSGLSARRTFIGTDKTGHAYIGIVNLTDLTLYRLSQLLDGMEVEWDNVLNLDGGPSSGLIVRTPEWNERMDSLTPVGSVIVVNTKD